MNEHALALLIAVSAVALLLFIAEAWERFR
jgi:hypothetical protein